MKWIYLKHFLSIDDNLMWFQIFDEPGWQDAVKYKAEMGTNMMPPPPPPGLANFSVSSQVTTSSLLQLKNLTLISPCLFVSVQAYRTFCMIIFLESSCQKIMKVSPHRSFFIGIFLSERLQKFTEKSFPLTNLVQFFKPTIFSNVYDIIWEMTQKRKVTSDRCWNIWLIVEIYDT